ncbi:MAG TPA: hypothetical protein DCQ31_18075 [Bacteroidales bacterium]|nr:hypothetical protein [Bacteroidales bacterium]
MDDSNSNFTAKAIKLLNNYPLPQNRISSHVALALQQPDFMIDTHMHIFDFDALPPNYFIKRQFTAIPDVIIQQIINLIDKYKTKNQSKQKEIEKNLHRLLRTVNLGEQTEESIIIMERFFLGEMKAMLELYLDNYVPKAYTDHRERVITTPLMMDMEPGWGNTANKNYIEQINEVKLIGKDFAILPFVNLDPRRFENPITFNKKSYNLYDIFLKAFTSENLLKSKLVVGKTTPFFGVKIYPILGYKPSDERLMPIFSICEKFQIPVTTHLGGTLIIQNPEIPNTSGLASGELNQAELWLPVLKAYPKLRLNIGHFGGVTEWQLAKTGTSTKIPAVLKLMEYENVYADISYIIAEETIHDILLSYLKKPEVLKKTLYGTDYWMLMREKNFKTNILNFCKKAAKIKVNGTSIWKHISKTNPVAFYGLNINSVKPNV